MQVSDGYFDTLGVTMRAGTPAPRRRRQSRDRKVSCQRAVRSAVLSQRGPLGKRIRLKIDQRLNATPRRPKPWMTIVGVAPNVRQRNVQDVDPDAIVYVSYRIDPPRGIGILIRSHGDPGALTSAVREGGAGHRSGSAGLRRADDGAGVRAESLAVSRVRNDVHDLRGDRPRAVGGRHLRGDRVLGHAAHAGDRRPDGARRAARPGVVADSAAGPRPARDRPDARHGRRSGRGTGPADAARPDQAQRSPRRSAGIGIVFTRSSRGARA